jgi:hypothetical protein
MSRRETGEQRMDLLSAPAASTLASRNRSIVHVRIMEAQQPWINF